MAGHWSQAVLIFVLALSGFGLHGTHGPVDFRTAVQVPSYAAIALIVLWIFTTFWHFTTGQWRQYLPKLSSLPAVIRFYARGILTGAPHPYHKSLKRKQNALQSLACLSFMVIIGPALWSSGIVYLTYPLWAEAAIGTIGLPAVAFVHTAAAFLMVTFVMIDVYMTTTGKTPTHYVETMITGCDTIELTAAEAAYLEEEEREKPKF
ncbi:cytochrome b/b6 domain-containing protein [Pinisolibacter aquiterrae]|uniref:cytochrome b/b6 domain-containing protein n=1 Tax=Pinisolibacter aquiterrae TaxID=2815579 RepID=UPI001C3CF9BE|nr:cytochrome b/b6 domain-containing protein [Pinisolibacter aquiterrae]MCC8235408.1 cytochrome b/b6 domain-containing protein [Pinisolibacter aquiterrae]